MTKFDVARFYKAIGWRLMALRQKHNLSVNEAASKASVSPSSWRAWESAKQKPTHFSIIQICQSFECNYGWFLTGRTNPEETRH